MKKDVIIRLAGICVDFDGERILDNINLDLYDQTFVTLLGPSGCGKTTTLRIIGGFEKPTSGRLFFENVDITDLPPYSRKVNTVFQKYALFPHLNVYDNVAFGLKLKKVPKKEIALRVNEMLELVNLTAFERRGIDKLSGGQQQRVAIARALINRPQVLLLDEPLGALDLKLRKEMQTELKKIQQGLGITFVYVTHDQEEALTMSDIVIVMNNGEIQQIGTPIDIYNEPENAFVADFIGESNIIEGIMKEDFLVSFLGNDFICVDKGFEANESVDVVLRPEDVRVVAAQDANITGVVSSVTFKGVHYEITVDSCGCFWLIHSTISQEPGNLIGLDFSPTDIHIMKKMKIPRL
ncbi:MAG: ABC transporter ATP-binding protein [Oscillospiraceae bacterium]|nr:ABC transporter ATP-binding protein [Oscillospiraceae bacterium]